MYLKLNSYQKFKLLMYYKSTYYNFQVYAIICFLKSDLSSMNIVFFFYHIIMHLYRLKFKITVFTFRYIFFTYLVRLYIYITSLRIVNF